MRRTARPHASSATRRARLRRTLGSPPSLTTATPPSSRPFAQQPLRMRFGRRCSATRRRAAMPSPHASHTRCAPRSTCLPHLIHHLTMLPLIHVPCYTPLPLLHPLTMIHPLTVPPALTGAPRQCACRARRARRRRRLRARRRPWRRRRRCRCRRICSHLEWRNRAHLLPLSLVLPLPMPMRLALWPCL